MPKQAKLVVPVLDGKVHRDVHKAITETAQVVNGLSGTVAGHDTTIASHTASLASLNQQLSKLNDTVKLIQKQGALTTSTS